ncbi:MAG: TonB-dependent receptor [Gammaproteobacteria bacterium]
MRSANYRFHAALVLCCVSGAAAGQALEEVTVTAQKREQNLQDVGISVAAFSGEAVRNLGLTSAVDALVKVPNVTNYSAYGPGSSANIVIRGIGLNDFGEGHEAPVTAYVDEMYLVAVPALGFSMFDLQRVEVLRGPQGTLFGRNSTGGLVHFLSARPTDTPAGFLQVTGGSFDEYKVEGAISGPLTEQLSGRLSILSNHSDGFLRNANPAFKPAGQAGTDAIRGQLQWKNDSGLTVLAKGEYGELDSRHLYYQQVPAIVDPTNGNLYVRDPGGTDGAGYNQATFRGGRAAAPDVADTDFPQHLKSHSSTGLLRIEKEFGDVTLTSISGYLDLSRKLMEDCDASPNSLCFATFPYSTQTFTQEIRLGSSAGATRWITGLYYLDADADNQPSATFNVPLDGPAGVNPATELYEGALFPIALSADWKLKTKSYSVFGQLEHDVTPALSLTAGVRITRDEKDFVDRDNASLRLCNAFPIPNNCFTDYTPQPYAGSIGETLYSGKLQADWRPMEDVLIYGSFSRGTKAGGFNNGFYGSGLPFDQIPYGDETVYATEIGAKTLLAGGRLRFNVSVFHYDYKDFQTFNWIGIGGNIVNKDGISQGVEVEIEGRLTEGLTAMLGLAGLDTKIKDVTLRDGLTTRDTEMAMAPKFSASGSLTYRRTMGPRGTLSLLWDFNSVSDHNSNNFNDPAADIAGYFKHNARISYQPNENWEIAALVNNIADKQVVNRVFVFDSLGYAQDMYTMPRTYAAQVSYRW